MPQTEVYMKAVKLLLALALFTFVLAAQTTNTYFEDFESNTEAGWTFTSSNAEVSYLNGAMNFTSSGDDVVYMFPPIPATQDDFSVLVQGVGNSAGGFGRIGFNSMIAFFIEDSIYIVYSENLQYYNEQDLVWLTSYPIPDEVISMELSVSRSNNDLTVNASVNGNNFYNGTLTNVNPDLFSGQMAAYMIEDENEIVFNLDHIEIDYNPYLNEDVTFFEDFNSSNIPWFRFGDMSNIYNSVSVNDGKLNFTYNGTEESEFYVMPPTPAVTDFTIEVTGGAGSTHNAPFGISRYFDYKTYITFFVEDNQAFLGYSFDSIEPIIVNSAQINLTTIEKIKFEAENSGFNIDMHLWINDQLIVSGTIENANERLLSGKLILGYDRGNIMDAYLESVSINYKPFANAVLSTTRRYHETFDANNVNGWLFLAPEADISTQNGELLLSTYQDDVIHILTPIEASTGDFSIEIKSGSMANALEGGGFGRMSFNSMVGLFVGGIGEGDDESLNIVYTEDIQSYTEPVVNLLGSIPLSEEMSSMKIEGIQSNGNLLVRVFINGEISFSGEIEDVSQELLSGNIFLVVDPDGSGELSQWSLDEIDIRYNPYLPGSNSYLENFDSDNIPWFRFGNFDNIVQSINIQDGKLNFNYNGTEETLLYVLGPVGAVKDFAIEVEGAGSQLHDAPFSISRVFDYKNYITFFIEDDRIHLGYAIDSWEPTIINSAAFNPQSITKVKFTVEGDAPNLTLTAMVNDQFALSGMIGDATEKIASGHIAFGYDRGTTVDAYINYAAFDFTPYITDVKDETQNIIAQDFQLYQNYPNPFNPTTTITFNLPKSEFVTLKIYDILGNEVAVLVNNEMNSGIHSINWNASQLSSGVYIYTISSQGKVMSNKMLLLK
jgi:hypothetical protein